MHCTLCCSGPCLHRGHTLGETAYYLSLHSPTELKLLNRDCHEVRGEENRRKINKLIIYVSWTDNNQTPVAHFLKAATLPHPPTPIAPGMQGISRTTEQNQPLGAAESRKRKRKENRSSNPPLDTFSTC